MRDDFPLLTEDVEIAEFGDGGYGCALFDIADALARAAVFEVALCDVGELGVFILVEPERCLHNRRELSADGDGSLTHRCDFLEVESLEFVEGE